MQQPIPSQPSYFFLHPAAVAFSFNALGDPDNLGISVYSNAQVLFFVRGIDGLDQLPDSQYRSWTLSAYPTHFTDDAGVARYCHLALSKATSQATLCFPDTRLDIYGRAITDDGQFFLNPDGSLVLSPNDTPEGDPSPSEDSATDLTPNPDHYFLFLGKITASGPRGAKQSRRWDNIAAYPITGTLDTAQYREYEQGGDLDKMFRFSPLYGNDGAILQLLPIVASRIWQLFIGTAEKVVNNLFRRDDLAPEDIDAPIEGGDSLVQQPTVTEDLDTVLPTEAHMRDYLEQKALSRVHDDTAAGHIDFTLGLTSHEDIDADKDIRALGNITSRDGHIGSSSFATGLLGNGWRINALGHGELDSLSLRKFLEVPELRFNRVSVHTGVQWQTFGGGLIEEVYPDPDGDPRRGIIKLHLEDGEYGAFAVNDLCMGIYHNENPDGGDNEDTNIDAHNGNFAFAGFQTIYFRVIRPCSAPAPVPDSSESGSTSDGGDPSPSALVPDSSASGSTSDGGDSSPSPSSTPDSRNQYFLYELRPDWILKADGMPPFSKDMTSRHPQPSMSFACYANPVNSERQSCVYSTTEYTIMLAGMTDWTYSSPNIFYIQGRLDGFTIQIKNPNPGPELIDYPLQGYGIGVGNIFKWGNETTLERTDMLISQQLYYTKQFIDPDTFLSPGYSYGEVNGNISIESMFTWTTDPQSPDSDHPYVYAYWLKTYQRGSSIVAEASKPFLFSTFGTMGESALYLRWSPSSLTVRMVSSGWIVDDQPAEVSMAEQSQNVGITASLIYGMTEQRPIFGITLGELPDELQGCISDFSAYNSNGDDWFVAFNLHDLSISAPVIIPVNVTIDSEGSTIPAPLMLTPLFDGADGYNGEDGADAVVYDIEPSLPNVVFDTEESEFVVDRLTFSFFRTKGTHRESCQATYRVIASNTAGTELETIEGTDADHVTIMLNASSARMSAYYFAVDMFVDGEKVKSLTVQRVDSNAPGAPGAPGTPGKDAVLFSIEPSSDAIHTNAAGTATSAWGCTMYRSEGDNRQPYSNTRWSVEVMNSRLAIKTYTFSGATFTLSQSALNMVKSVTVTAYDTTVSRDSIILVRTYYPVADGAAGIQGVVVRQMGEWQEDVAYVNQSQLDITGIRYLDIVQYRVNGLVKYYECKPTGKGEFNQGHIPTDTAHWTAADMFNFIATELLLAQNAHIDFLSGNAIYLHGPAKEDGTTDVTIGLQGGATNNTPMIFAGAIQSEAADAPFQVLPDGTVKSANINNEFQDVRGYDGGAASDGEVQIIDNGLNIANIRTGSRIYDGEGNWIQPKKRVYNLRCDDTVILLPTAAEFIGQRIMLYNGINDSLMIQNGYFGKGTTYVQQQGGKTFLGVGITTKYTTGFNIGNLQTYKAVSYIGFMCGVMEFVGTPDDDGTCRWAVVNDGVAAKWYDGTFIS